MNKRKIFFDTETTGQPSYAAGHRIVEIAAVELLDNGQIGRTFHSLINPGRDIPEDVVAIHGITNEKVAGAPRFKDVIDGFLDFIKGAEIYAHNASFDENFISGEMTAINHPKTLWQDIDRVVDTLALSRRLAPKERQHSLDAILDRYQIDRGERTFHNALLDCKLLAQAYLKLTEGVDLTLPSLEDDVPPLPVVLMSLQPANLLRVQLSPEQQQRHEAYLEGQRKDNPNLVAWATSKPSRPSP